MSLKNKEKYFVSERNYEKLSTDLSTFDVFLSFFLCIPCNSLYSLCRLYLYDFARETSFKDDKFTVKPDTFTVNYDTVMVKADTFTVKYDIFTVSMSFV